MLRAVILCLAATIGLAGCQKYEIEFQDTYTIVEQTIVKSPDQGAAGALDGIAVGLKAIDFDPRQRDPDFFYRIEVLECGNVSNSRRIRSAIYFSEDVVFDTEPHKSSSSKDFFAVYTQDQINDFLFYDAVDAEKLCLRLVNDEGYFSRETSNIVAFPVANKYLGLER